MMGIVWTQAAADILNVIISYIIYFRVLRQIKEAGDGSVSPAGARHWN